MKILTRLLPLSLVLYAAGCASQAPEAATRQLVRGLNRDIQGSGLEAFEHARIALGLREPHRDGHAGDRRTANWSRDRERLALVSSNVPSDAPERYDLGLSWYPPRALDRGLVERLLGPPYGV